MNSRRKRNTKHLARPLLAVLCLMASMLLCAATDAGDRVSVRAPDNVYIDPQHLQLMHVADVTGGAADVRQAIGAVSIGEAPDPGQTRIIDRADITAYLQKGGVAIDTVSLQVPERILVHRNAVTISDAFLEQIVMGYLLKRTPWPSDRVRVVKFTVNGETVLPSGKITYRVLPPPRLDFLRTIPFTVEFYVDGILREKTWVTVNLLVTTQVVVTSQPIGRNQSISEADIKLVDMDLAELPTGVITSPEDVIGLRARRTLHIDTPLREDLVARPPLVDRGDIVKIVLEIGGLTVSTLGEVKEKGRRGEQVSVINLESNRRVMARVVDSKTVKVAF
ncbi:MAG: flagellar basal body P-ring formation chaperone FlgA [Pseudomonadota bacterium]